MLYQKVVLSIASLLVVACANPIANPNLAPQTGYSISVALGDSDPSTRGLLADSGVSSVRILVDSALGVSLGSGTLTKGPSAWTGQIDVSATGQAQFRADALGSSGQILYVGKTLVTLAGTNDTVSVTVGAAALKGGAIQGQVPNLSTAVSTLAGAAGVTGSTDATGTSAQFAEPFGIATDGTNLYIADATNQTIRQVVIATGVSSTLAGTTGVSGVTGPVNGTGTATKFDTPSGIVTDGTNLFVADMWNDCIRKIVISSKVVTTFVTLPFGSHPRGITSDGANLYVTAFAKSSVYKTSIASPYATVLAGSTSQSGSTDSTNGTGTTARFNQPLGITTDGTYLYVTEQAGNNTIRKIVIATGEVSTLAGLPGGYAGSQDGTGSGAQFSAPAGIATDGTNLYVADYNSSVIRKVVISSGVVTTIAGTSMSYANTDAVGAAARFQFPAGITTDGSNLYVSDSGNHTIRKIQ